MRETSASYTRRCWISEFIFVRYRFYPLGRTVSNEGEAGVGGSNKEVVPVKGIGIQYMGVISVAMK